MNGSGFGSPLLAVPFALVNVRVMSMVPGRVQLPLKSGLPFGRRGAGAFGSNFFTFSDCAETDTGDRTTGSTSAVTITITLRRIFCIFIGVSSWFYGTIRLARSTDCAAPTSRSDAKLFSWHTCSNTSVLSVLSTGNYRCATGGVKADQWGTL